MTLHVFSLQHDRQGLSAVEYASARAEGLPARALAHPGVRGVVLLSTCNRVELLVDTAPGVCGLRALLDEHFGSALPWTRFGSERALRHLFEVACGLQSMVVGEREVAGQLRRALAEAQAAGGATLPLTIAVEEALRTSRLIANETSLESTGRSIVAEGLSLVRLDDWATARVLIVGTGSYAGAVVAALRHRGVTDLRVYSGSGRAEAFAASHNIVAVSDLSSALAEADLTVTCRGRGIIVGVEDVRPGLRILDLSLVRDVDQAVALVPNVQLVDLEAVQAHVGDKFAEDHAEARRRIAAGVASAMTKLRSRIVDPAVTELRQVTEQLVAEEAARLPERPLTRDEAAYALRRLAARMLHVPSTRARLAAKDGRTGEYLEAMHELYGIGDPPTSESMDGGACCPVTGFSLDDLRRREQLEDAL